jgi:hypothetical protein
MTQPITPDDVNDIVNDGGYRVTTGTEQGEAQLMSVGRMLAELCGPEEFRLAVAKMGLPLEAELRRDCPNHPTLEDIDYFRSIGRLE